MGQLSADSSSTETLYCLNSAIGFAMTYPLDSDLSGGQRYPSFEHQRPGG